MSTAVTKPVDKSVSTPTKVQYKGLCSTCMLANDCVFPRDAGRPVMHCDEFVGMENPLTIAAPRKVAVNQPQDSVEYKGLCRNCEERFTCTYPKPAGGVWRCEEYR